MFLKTRFKSDFRITPKTKKRLSKQMDNLSKDVVELEGIELTTS
jgi:hypothetical protein